MTVVSEILPFLHFNTNLYTPDIMKKQLISMAVTAALY